MALGGTGISSFSTHLFLASHADAADRRIPSLMKMWLRILIVCPLLLNAVAAAPTARDETVFIFQNRRVTITVPEGLGFASGKDDRGIISVRLGHPAGKVSLELTFLPDPSGQFATARGRKEFLNETFHAYVASSVERAMQFEELDPRAGAGTYCIFSDASLVGKATLPPGEFLHSTTGLKTWSGVGVVFTLFSNDPRSDEHQSLMTMLRESVVEKPGPLR
jgi:hypothetical protein